MQLSDFDYQLPNDRIAQMPAEPRDHSKLLVVDRSTGTFRDAHFYDLPELLTDQDVLVVNDTKVFPARLMVETPKPVELLMEKELSLTPDTITWEVLTKPGLKLGQRFTIPNTHVTGVCGQVNDYTRVVTFQCNREAFYAMLDHWAKTPIPPYIRWNTSDEASLRLRYQTVYATRVGAVAAPTAGLHFTPELFERLKQRGVAVYKVTLHVGLGTFLPVKTDDISKHHMHEEWFDLGQPTAVALNEAKAQGKHIVAVGTTTVRVLETCAKNGVLVPRCGTTAIFITPPYQYQFVNKLITNFHTPKSTLLMLVSALVSAPNTSSAFSTFSECLMGKAYEYALANQYRFYSFGDAMLIL